MTVYYYKGAKILAPFSIISNEPMYDVDTVSLGKQRASQNAQRWEMSFTTVGEPSTQVDMLLGAVTNTDSAQSMIMPQLPSVDASFTVDATTVALANSASAGATSVVLNTTDVDGFLPKGSFVSFSGLSGSDKVYLVMNDVNLDAVANPTVQLYPQLKVQIGASNTMKMGSAVLFKYYTDISNLSGITFTDGVLSNAGTITLIEALS